MSDKSRFLAKGELSQYRAIVAKHGPLEKAQRLFVDHARAQGGLTLEVWRLLKGPWFGEPQTMGVEGVAEALGIPVSDVHRVMEETHAVVSPKIRAMLPQLRHVSHEIDSYARRHGHK